MNTMTPQSRRRECAICFSSQYSDNPYSPERFYSTPCDHHFHFHCLETWCRTNNSCPTCRFDTVMNLSYDNDNSTISSIYSTYFNNIVEQSSSPQDELPTTHQDIDNLNNNENNNENNNYNYNIFDIDNILDNIRNDYHNTGVIHSNSITALLIFHNSTLTTRSNNNNYNYVNNNENYYVRDRYRNMITRYNQRINQNNIRNNNQILENNYRRNNVRLNQRRNSVINLDDLDAQIT